MGAQVRDGVGLDLLSVAEGLTPSPLLISLLQAQAGVSVRGASLRALLWAGA